MKDFFNLSEIIAYFFTKKKDQSINIRIMHFINKLAIVIFLVGIIYLIATKY